MTTYFGYIRVSTVRQGERGSSLVEQKSAIEAYAARHGLTIDGWFEEMETAAKQGRRLFNKMLAELAKGRTRGVIMHKIDRSARNLKDWAQLGELIDAGVEVHFAHEALDLASRGGRLSADIQAVVAADYIRNLRDEVKKGFYGRLKQGFYPLPAPVGYLDQGKARPKVIDPIKGPLVREAFDLYATGQHSLEDLVEHLSMKGLTGRHGGPIARATLASLFRNPFYIGLIEIARTGETFAGAHEPLVDKRLFDQVAAVAAGRHGGWTSRRAFPYRRLIDCAGCQGVLTGELQKGHVYYRCHRCPGVSLREDRIDDDLGSLFARLALSPEDLGDIGDFAESLQQTVRERAAVQRQIADRDLGLCETKLSRLTDLYLEGGLERELFELRKRELLEQRQALRVRIDRPDDRFQGLRLLEDFELLQLAQQRLFSGDEAEKRALVKALTSNLTARGKSLEIRLRFPFDRMLQRPALQYGGPYRTQFRTWLLGLIEEAAENVSDVSELSGLRRAA